MVKLETRSSVEGAGIRPKYRPGAVSAPEGEAIQVASNAHQKVVGSGYVPPNAYAEWSFKNAIELAEEFAGRATG